MKSKNSVPTEIPVEEVVAVEETPVAEEIKPVVEETPAVKEKPEPKNNVGVVTAKILAVRKEPSIGSPMIGII